MPKTYLIKTAQHLSSAYPKASAFWHQSLTKDSLSFEICENISCVYNLCQMEENTFCLLYKNNDNILCLAYFTDEKKLDEKKLFNCEKIEYATAFFDNDTLKIMYTHFVQNQKTLNMLTLSKASPYTDILCQNCTDFKSFFAHNQIMCAYYDANSFKLSDCKNSKSYTICHKVFADFSLCFDESRIYIAATDSKNVVLFTLMRSDGSIKQLNVFKGSYIKNCLVFINDKTVFVCGADNKNIYFKYSTDGISFSPSAVIPLKTDLFKASVLSGGQCCEAYVYSHNQVFMPLFYFLYTAKPFKKSTPIKMTAQKNSNSLFELRLKAAQDKYISTIHDLQQTQMQTNEEIENLKKTNENLTKENNRLKHENDILKKAKKLLEDEIYNINNNHECSE